MTTPKKTAKSEPLTYINLRALKAAKTRKLVPRGLKAEHRPDEMVIAFTIPKQDIPVLTVDSRTYVADCLRASGFRLAD